MKLTKEFVNRCRRMNVLRDFLCQAIDQIDAMEEERRWRKSSQELPEDNRIVLGIVVRYDKTYYYTLNYRISGAWVESDYPEYWMPLPKAPEIDK